MDESRFWTIIQGAWASVGGYQATRRQLAQGISDDEAVRELEGALDEVMRALEAALELLDAPELLTFDRILERKLYDIDRAEVHEATDGSDDGFLYARGFIVALGQEFYEAVNANPSKALMDFDCEAMCYPSRWLYEQKFGEMPASGISRESVSNQAGWAEA